MRSFAPFLAMLALTSTTHATTTNTNSTAAPTAMLDLKVFGSAIGQYLSKYAQKPHPTALDSSEQPKTTQPVQATGKAKLIVGTTTIEGYIGREEEESTTVTVTKAPTSTPTSTLKTTFKQASTSSETSGTPYEQASEGLACNITCKSRWKVACTLLSPFLHLFLL